jgi:tetratricopeptide (TPR) repeat protein
VIATGLAVLAWALHPRLTECAAWISGRTDLLATAFALATLLAWPERARADVTRRALAAVLFLAGLLSKEIAIVVVPIVLAREVMGDAREGEAREMRARALAALRRAAPLGIALAAYVALRVVAMGTLHLRPEAAAAFSIARVLAALATYAGMLVDPRANAQIGDARFASAPLAYAGVVVVIVLGAWVVRAVRARDAASVTAALLVIAGVLPVVHIVPLPGAVLAADRFLYVPLAGVVLGVAAAAERASRRAHTAVGALAAAVSIAWTPLTLARIEVWCDEVRFWTATTLAAAPTNPLPAEEYANLFYRASKFTDALALEERLAQRSLRGSTEWKRVESNAAGCLSQLGRYDDALAIRRELLAMDPSPRRWFDVGLVLLHAQSFDAAEDAFGRALALASDYADAAQLLAASKAARATRPADGAAIDDVARWLESIGARREAELAWRAALSTRIPESSAFDGLAFLVEHGSLESAAAAMKELSARDADARKLATFAIVLEDRERTSRDLDASRAIVAPAIQANANAP